MPSNQLNQLRNIIADHAQEVDSPHHAEIVKYNSLVNSVKGVEEYMLSKDGTILRCKLENATITGYEEWEVIGKHISIFYSLEDQLAGKPFADLENAQKVSVSTHTGIRMKKRNTSFWAKVKLITCYDNDAIVGFKMILQDATHKAMSNYRLRRLRDEYLNLFNNSFVGIFRFNIQNYSIMMMNEKALRLTGLSDEQEKKTGFNEIFENANDFIYLVTHLRTSKKINDMEFQLRNEKRWAMISCRYFDHRNYVEGIIFETTGQRKSDLELERLRNELDQFIYHASHELRAPIVSMLGITNLIDIEKDPNNISQLTSIMKDKLNQLDELLKNVTSISYNNQNVVLNDAIQWENLIESLLKELKPLIQTHIQVFYSVEQDHNFYSDMSRVRTIIKNVVANALKYVNPMSENASVNMKVVVNKEIAHILIMDNGIGIEKAYLKDIFKMFFKASEYPKGPGLGLYIAKVMLDKIGGKIQVDSWKGKGTTVLITIPNRNAACLS
jgi:signal transduction histidine kinase